MVKTPWILFLTFVVVFVAGNALAASFRENNGAVVIEAEHYDNLRASLDGGNVSWGLRNDTANYLEDATSNGEYLYVGANPVSANYGNFGQNVLSNAPRADFAVEFKTGGTYYIWVRGNQNPGNSVFVVADFQSTAATVQGAGDWVWWNDDQFLTPVAQVALTAGVHTISIYQREADCGVDKIILTRDAGFVPTGFGPEETTIGIAHTPVPANGNAQVDSTAVTSVSWYSPLQDGTGAIVGASGIVSVNGYTVWFGTAAPNTSTFTLSQSLPVSLSYRTTYSWRVDTHVTRTGNIADVIEGQVWQFTTLPAPPPNLSVYPPVPGLASSPHYSFRVHEVGSTQWFTPFAWLTECQPGVSGYYYYGAIIGWSNTYCNFEIANNVPIEVEITKLNPSTGMPVDIQKATPHPRRKVRSWRLENGKAYVIFDKPVLFAVDIDGQMDEQITPSPSYNWGDWPFLGENAIHTVTVFANPFILDKPDLSDPDVYAVEPGQIPPDNGTWKTLYFKPGVHQIFDGPYEMGDDFRVRSNKSYYIPGDAIVHGNMNNNHDSTDAKNIRIFGHGTLSGARIPHAGGTWGIPDEERWPTSPIWIGYNATNCRVEGVTLADPAYHTCALAGNNTLDASKFNYARWAKTFTWRANGDGIQSNGGTYVEDCFMRTQDDGSYITGMGTRRIVYWIDCNGSPLRGSFLTSDNGATIPGGKLYFEDIDIIYGRTIFGGPGSVISVGDLWNHRYDGSHVVLRNINFEDPLPKRRLLGWDTRSVNGNIAGVRLENVRTVAPEVVQGAQDVILGDPNSHIRNLIFNNCVLAGQHYDSLDDFVHNEYVYDFVFQNTALETMTYLNTSGYGKWYVYGDWNRGVEPANNDVVNHTAVAAVLTVDAPAYAGTLNIAHADTATVSIALDGKLTITNAISLGAAGGGKLNLLDGTLKLQNSIGSALSVANGTIHIENGTLLWAGNHISDIQSLYTAGKMTMAKGQNAMLSASATLIGQYGQSKLYADYNNATAGYTTVWVARLTEQVVTLHVEAENYTAMSGIQKENSSDTGGGQIIGYINGGDWAQYTINVPTAGTYQVDFWVASATTGGTISMVVGSSTVGSAAVTGSGGWQTWKTVRTTATFSTAGTQTLRLNFVGGTGYLYNINWFKCTMSIPFLPGDFNGDKKVNLADFALMSKDWQDGYEMTDLLEIAGDWLMLQ